MKFKWLWFWKDHSGILHMTANSNEAERAVHENKGKTIWAERVRENGIRKFNNNLYKLSVHYYL